MKVFKNVLYVLVTLLLVLAIAAIAIPKLFGVEFRAVLTGSMSPDIPVGSMVVVVPTEAKDIKVGDDITFINAGNQVVTHRVVEINANHTEFTTHGIANNQGVNDPPNKIDNIRGVVRFHVPVLGRMFDWFTTTQNKIIAITVIVSVFLLTTIISIWTRDIKKKPEDETQAEDENAASSKAVVAEATSAPEGERRNFLRE